MMASRYAHAKQFKRHHRQLRLLRSRLGRIIRDILRKIAGRPELAAVFEAPLARAAQIRSQQQRQRGWKLYSFHAPEVECIGKGKASAPYEFGVKAPIVTTNACAPGGQFVLHAKALPGNPYDGHTLGSVIDATEKLTGCAIERAYVDKGYRGHDTANLRRVFISGQKRGVFGIIKRELRRRSAIEPVIGHMKTDGHLGRCHLKGREGDAANVILTAVGHNLRRILAWLRDLLRLILALCGGHLPPCRQSDGLLNGRLPQCAQATRTHRAAASRDLGQHRQRRKAKIEQQLPGRCRSHCIAGLHLEVTCSRERGKARE
jgi:IS5 family transposase